ncbi:MAG: protein-glutamate O-methyltransferase CheR [Chloroflexi bacterium]|nr:protein-glutamate O-methyltransferase CheR [Chloroflexota bacterium]MDA1219547.1 protein-glutamate O-methyltransferase CheR [Chloroflexota bacterium]
MTDQEYTYLQETILRLTGINLESYKTQQMRRRLEGFIARIPGSGVGPYCEMLQKDKEAQQRLKDFMTINVSEFFRDSDQFTVLKNRILPGIIAKSASPVLIWSAGCSIGAEPYSLAIMMNELAPKRDYRITATDLDQTILNKAKAGGPYKQADLKNVNKQQLMKYFTRSDEDFKVVDSLKAKIDFRQQNLLTDTFAKGFDLIICRNVVIYFTDEAKRKINQGFYNSLKEDGILFIGGTETLLDAQQLGFKRMSASFYEKTPASDAAQPVTEKVLHSKV